jgi:ABC-type transporter Mla maintaining outer membrane lipid asymmetry ATPase subunit MlaF
MASNQTYSSIDNADRFSELSRSKRKDDFIALFKSQYPWIEDLSIEVVAGGAAIYASVAGMADKIPITSVSGGINRMITLLLMIASRQRSVVLLDEVENGLFHTHHKAFWQALLKFARQYESQLFITTHSEEWLEAFALVADDNIDDVSLWRMERTNKQPKVRQFTGKQVVLGVRAGEVR